MKNKILKLVAVFMSVLLVFGAVPVSALAVNTQVNSKSEISEKIILEDGREVSADELADIILNYKGPVIIETL